MNPLTEKQLEKMLKQSPSGTDLDSAVQGLLARAEREGLIDVAYAPVDSPFGRLLIAKTDRGVVRLKLPTSRGHQVSDEEALQNLATYVSPRLLESPKRLDEERRQLEEYFEGRRTGFDLAIDWSLSQGFTQRILQATAKVPFGQLATYRDMATKAGNERAVRAAGNALGSNHIPIVVPCHRIIRTGGALGGYTGGLERKEFLLKLEGVLL